MEEKEDNIPIKKTIEKKEKKSHHLKLCESILKDYYYVHGDYTYKHRRELKGAGFKWNPDCRLWMWEDVKTVDVAKKAIEDILSSMKKTRKESAKKATKTKNHKKVYENNKELIDEKIKKLEEFNMKIYGLTVIWSKEGYCTRCKRNWALDLDVEKYKDDGLSGCPNCGRDWFD